MALALYMFQTLGTLVRNGVGWVFTLGMSGIACVLGLVAGMPGLTLGWLVLCKPWARGCLRLGRIEVEVVGREQLVGPAIFASNHQSLIDVVFLPAVLPRRLKWVAKRALANIPLWGWAFRAGGVFIDRGCHAQAVESIRHGIEGLPADWSLCIFPEGTRSSTGALGPFRKGVVRMALQSRLPIVPMGFYGAHVVTPIKGSLVRPGVIQLTVGPRLNTDHWSAERIDEHLAEVHRAVAACVEESRRRHLLDPRQAQALPEVLSLPADNRLRVTRLTRG